MIPRGGDTQLVGTLAAYGKLGQRNADTQGSFQHAGAQLTAARDGQRSPTHVAEVLWAFGEMYGRTDFANLPSEIRDVINKLIETARGYVPEPNARLERKRRATVFERNQLVHLIAALMLFRHPPPEMRSLLAEARPHGETYLSNTASVPLEVLDSFFLAMGIARGDHAAIAPSYRAAIRQIEVRIEKYDQPSVDLVRLTVRAYEGRSALGQLARWYEREASLGARSRDASAVDGDPREIARDLRTADGEAGAHLEVVLASLLGKIRRTVRSISPATRRRIVSELTRLRSLPTAELPEDLDEVSSELADEDGGVGDDDRPVRLAPPNQQRLANEVAGVLADVSASPAMIGDIAELPPPRQVELLATYAWLRKPARALSP